MTDLSIDARLDILSFFNNPSVTPESWEEFKNIFGDKYTKEEFDKGASLFYQPENHKVIKIPEIIGYKTPSKGEDSITPSTDIPTPVSDIKDAPEEEDVKVEEPKEEVKDEPQETTAKTVTIDGITVGTESIFLPTEAFVREYFAIFNSKYFNDELSLEGVPVSIRPIKNALAYVQSLRYSHKVTKFEVSNLYKRSEKTFCSTIIHEMIHMWQHQVNNSSGGHGWDFKRKMNEINHASSADGSIGWQVSTTETVEEAATRGNLDNDSPLARKIKNTAYLMVGILRNPNFCWLWKKDQVAMGLTRNMRRFENAHVYKINNVAPIRTTHIVSKWNTSGISGTTISQKDIDDMLQNGDIVELDRESVINGTPSALKESINDDFEIIDVDTFIKTDDDHHRILIDDNGMISDIYL